MRILVLVSLLLAAQLLAACTSPAEPMCVKMIVALPGYELNADSLEAKGWTVLPGDTIAAYEVDCEEAARV